MGKTKRGNGTKFLLTVEGHDLLVYAFTYTAQAAEVNNLETLIGVQVAKLRPDWPICDIAAAAGWLRGALDNRGV